MFHANAWALTFAHPAAGASLVMPGAGMDGKSIYELLDSEKVLHPQPCQPYGWVCCNTLKKMI